jgi:hypothetical protein
LPEVSKIDMTFLMNVLSEIKLLVEQAAGVDIPIGLIPLCCPLPI